MRLGLLAQSRKPSISKEKLDKRSEIKRRLAQSVHTHTFKYQGYDETRAYDEFSKKTDLTRDSLISRKKDSNTVKYLIQDKKYNEFLSRNSLKNSEMGSCISGRPETAIKSTFNSNRPPFILSSVGSSMKQRAVTSEGFRSFNIEQKPLNIPETRKPSSIKRTKSPK